MSTTMDVYAQFHSVLFERYEKNNRYLLPKDKYFTIWSRSKVKKNATLPFFSKNILTTVTRFGTVVPCGKALQIMGLYGDSLTQGQGHNARSKVKKARLPCFPETIQAIVTTFWFNGTVWQGASKHML